MSQTERHFNNGTGDDSAGRPGDKRDSNGNALWKPDAMPDPQTGNYSGLTYSNTVNRQDWHTRDFDYLGYRYSVLSTIGTAGRNLVVANVPARDLEDDPDPNTSPDPKPNPDCNLPGIPQVSQGRYRLDPKVV